MKNEQSNQSGKHDQGNAANSQYDQNQQQGGDKSPQPQTTDKNSNPSSSQNGNIAVDNEGKIGKAHDQWGNDEGAPAQGQDVNYQKNQQKNDKSQQKMPQQESNKNSK